MNLLNIFLSQKKKIIKHFSYSLQLFLIDLTIQLLTHIVTESHTKYKSRRIKKVKVQTNLTTLVGHRSRILLACV